ncbi:MAG: fimbrial assembly protein [Terracidiphilus sp.]|jgi:type IV pilus assembly protein PilN
MRIALNLATRPFADLGPAIKRLRIAIGVLILLAIGLGLGLRALHQKAEEARARDHSLDGQIARISQERQQYQELMHQPANAQLLTQAAALNKLFDVKAFSWTLAMEDLETVLPGGVQVTTLEPVRDDKSGKTTLHLRVLGPRDKAVELVRNLEHSKRFLLPRIVGENAEASEGPNQRLEPVSASNRFNFDLLAEYNPAPAGERRPARSTEKPTAAGEYESRPAAAHPVPGLVGQPGRPLYTGAPQPMTRQPKPNPALYPNRTPGGPQ